jgi:minor extracellular serine protease Vpr
MKRNVALLTITLSLLFALQFRSGVTETVSAHSEAVAQQNSADGVREGSVAVVVELDSEPVARHERLFDRTPRLRVDFEGASAVSYESRLDAEHADFKSRAAQIAPEMRIRAELRKLANAVSIEVTDDQLAAISKLPGVKHVEPVKEVHALLDTSVPLIQAPALWEKLGGISAAGDGIKIAVLDTGIDITNPLFSDTGFTMPAGFPKTSFGSDNLVNNKVIAAKSFVQGANSALDQNGHGSNCAGIAAGSNASSPIGSISGVAPRAYLGNYRVLGATGSGRTDLIAQAIEEAVQDGFDVLSMSFGGDAGVDLDIAARAAENAVLGGRIVVAAAGNNGNAGEMTVTSPGIAPSAITVAASTNGHIVGPVITVDQPSPVDASLTRIGSSSGNAVQLDDNLKSLPFVYADSQGRGCSALPGGSLSGKVALIERGVCAFSDKINNASAAGAKAVIVFNKDLSEGSDGGETIINMDVAGTTIPSLFVSRSAGLALRDFANSHPNASLSIAPIGSRSAISDVLASFSSRGPSSLELLKPDVAAPGVVIYSAALKTGDSSVGVVDSSGFLAINGTSQATPHVAGSAALLRQLHPSWTSSDIKSALMNSAVDVFTTTDKNARAGVLDVGAGRIDLARAGAVGTTISPASLSFGINKLKKKDVTSSIDLTIANKLNVQSPVGISIQQLDPGDGVTVSTSSSNLVVPAGQSSTVTITIFALKGSERRDYTGYVLITDSSQTLRVPYWVRYVKKRS